MKAGDAVVPGATAVPGAVVPGATAVAAEPRRSRPAQLSVEALLESDDFKQLVVRRWRASLILTAILFVVYYGFILLVATNKPLLSIKLGSATLGIVLGVSVILLSWAITAAYVVWANRHYDPEVRRLRERLR
jgi:uncharacterized membrane protein (DUF485 family)